MLVVDTLENLLGLALLPSVWLFLYLLAWEDTAVARASGFGRRTFWLLVPAGLLGALLGTLPFFAWDGSIVAVNVAGALIPIVLSLLAFRLLLGGVAGPLRLLAALAVESALMFAAVLLVANPTELLLLVLLVGAAVPIALAAADAIGPGTTGRGGPAYLLAPTSLALVVTFLTTQAVPGVGIVSAFPDFLIAPVLAGALALPIVRLGLRADPARALSLAYGSSTLGTLLGADLLRQPPLYGAGQAGLLSIGGAGVLDLVYLSGPIAAAIAYLMLLAAGRARAPTSEPTDSSRPVHLLRASTELASAGHHPQSIGLAAAAVAHAESSTRRTGSPDGRPPGGVVWAPSASVAGDQANLRALAETAPTDPRETLRAWRTAQRLVRAWQEIGRARFADPARRLEASFVDALLTTLPALAVMILLVRLAGGGILQATLSLPFLAATLGYAGWAFAYLALAEGLYGRTLGKAFVGIAVVEEEGRPVGARAAMLRNLPKLVPLTLLGTAAAVLALQAGVGLAPSGTSGLLPASSLLFALAEIFLLLALAVLVAIPLLIGWAFIAASPDNQRLGDRLAGTFVVNRAGGSRRSRAAASAAPTASSG